MANRVENSNAHKHNGERLRVLLGFTQMGLAAFSAALVIYSGINRLSMIAVVLTCTLTTTSVLLFGSRKK